MNLVINGRLITRDEGGKGYYEHGAVAYEGATITEVGQESALRAKYPQAHIIDAKGGVIMPAFINAHTHIYSALARGLSIVGNNPTNFYEVLDGTWWAIDRKLTLEGTRASADALYMDCIKQGVTTIFDHHASYAEIPGSLHTIAESAKKFGIRSCLCYEVSDRDGEEKCLQAIQENADFITECQKNQDPMLAAMFGGHALFTISDKTFDRMVAANNGRTGYHIHVSEGMNDVYDSLQNYGRRPVQRLQDHGILGPKTILGHCIHVNTAEMDIIKETGTMVVNNPESNMGNAIGICPVLQLHKRGILLGMGTDAYTNEETVEIVRRHMRSEAVPRSTRIRASAVAPEHPLVGAAAALGVERFVSPTTSDMALMAFPSLKMGAGDSARSHTADEYVLRSEVEQGVEGYIRYIAELAKRY